VRSARLTCSVPAPSDRDAAGPPHAEPRHGRLTSFDGTEIAFQEWGDDLDGLPPVVLHHGFVADASTNWVLTGVVAALLDAGRRVIAPDARGHGRSGKPHDPSFYGEANMARDLAALVAELGYEQIDLAGYSMGAIVALLYAAGHGSGVRRLVVGGVGSGVVECGGVDRRLVSNDAIKAALSAEGEQQLAGLDPAAAAFRRLADALGDDRQALLAQAASIHRDGVELNRITAPTLLLAGDRDPLATRPQVLVDAIPDARLELLEGDHMSIVGQPRFAAAIVGFLAG
jgi:pimeloyl-ACP methyl ester carboxylesterase